MGWFLKLDASLVGVSKLVLKIELLPVGATSSQLLPVGFSLLPPGILNFLLDMAIFKVYVDWFFKLDASLMSQSLLRSST